MNLLFSFGNRIRPTRGGTERVTSLVANGLRARGHRVYFLITEEEPPPSLPTDTFCCSGMKPREKAVYAHRLCLQLDIRVLINEAGTSDDVRFLNRETLPPACHVITCIHFDIVSDLHFFYRCFLYRIQSWRDLLRIVRLPHLKRLHTRNRRQRYRYLLQQSDAVVVPAQVLVRQFFDFTGCAPDTRVLSIPNPAVFAPEWVDTKEPIALFVGRFSPEKHVEHLLKAWALSGAEQKGWQLILAGDGALRPALERQASKLRLQRVRFIGHQHHPAPLYRKATLFLLASDYESFSLVIQEALSFACYPIVYDFPALAQLLAQPEWGTALPLHKPQAMADAIRLAISQRLTNLPHQQAIHAHLATFSLPAILHRWEQLLHRIS